MSNQYILQVGELGSARLAILNQVYGATSRQILQSSGLKPGMSVLEYGCGTGNMTIWLAKQVGEQGRVLAVDISPEQLAIARKNAEHNQCTNIQFKEMSVNELARLNQSFDLIYGRFVLMYSSDAYQALQALCHTLKPGGSLVCEEVDMPSWKHYPESMAFNKHIELFIKVGEQKSQGDFVLGPKLKSYFHHLGLQDVRVNVVQPAFETLQQKLHPEMVTRECAEQYLASGLISEMELNHLLAELHQLAHDEESIVLGARTFQTLGKAPIGA